ncbi:hypothetical protein F3K40_17250 [Streptomyces sp. LBUM 1478]|uniref:DUF6174 domain-containing protein n=1 Tax=Streptomyces scabiei TaxID=1930 RepID=UPI000765AB97|nr:DUF6174 domain-containing protein [Streptomyces scabiei]MBP5907123.1 hypothetical protein [Streptomyces sp. LBUM 1478]MBP5930034.1 hypothetical protein [Streptomyces sp. LBUM 1479]MDX3281669.1 DUF6174 domain-containing protein [Streptomyces scabiei]
MTTPATVRVRHRALTAAALAGTLLSTLSACREEPREVATPAPSWKEPSAYRYTLTSSEGERSLIGTFAVTVRDGKVVKATGLDDSARRAVERNPSEVPTIAGLLKQAETARRDGSDIVDVDYAKDGRPTALSIDWDEDAIDDEEAYTLSDYEALG